MNEYMICAYQEAMKAYKKKEIPVGAVIVKNNKILAKAHNNRQKKKNVLGHAEINCILKAEKKLKDWRLDGCDIYITLKPCDMCKIVIKESRINNVYYMLDREGNISQKFTENEYAQCYSEKIKVFFKNLRD